MAVDFLKRFLVNDSVTRKKTSRVGIKLEEKNDV